MAKKVITNEFKKGLVMDLSPENTPNQVLTNALNATLLTYNGNEMSLQNDMGNGRVETAFLPEGYMPLGTCEFGGIIYIVSYNPQIDRCQIGSFPSPERNVTSEELGLSNITIRNSDFQGSNGFLKTLSKKYILNQNNLNPGDKYLITLLGETKLLDDNKEYLSGLKINEKGEIIDLGHKKLNLKIVSISDNNKVLALDDFQNNYFANPYYYKFKLDKDTPVISNEDIDSYRSKVSQEYSVYSSKTSGKLAILAELETIDQFSCTHTVKLEEVENKNIYTVAINCSWQSSSEDIQPKYVLLEDLKWSLPETVQDSTNTKYYLYESEYVPGSVTESSFTNNAGIETIEKKLTVPSLKSQKFKLNVENHDNVNILLLELQTPNTVTIKNNFGDNEVVKFINPAILDYTVTPAMSFGILDQLSITNRINFALIQTSTYELSGFKYHVTDDFITISLTTDIYEGGFEETKEINLHFYDEDGYCGTHQILNKESYSGNFVIVLNSNSNCLTKIVQKKDSTFDTNKDGTLKKCLDENNEEVKSILSTDKLYLIKIDICYYDAQKQKRIYKDNYRWMYTTGEFNNYYYEFEDFIVIKPVINVAFTANIKDNTTKTITNPNIVDQIINPEQNEISNSITTDVTYNGTLDVSLQLVSASKYFSGDFSGEIHPLLYYSKENDKIVEFGVTQSNDIDDPDISKYTFKINNENKTVLSNNESFNFPITVNIPTTFTSNLEDVQIETKQAQVLTPILFDEDYDSIGIKKVNGGYMFKSALGYAGSDDSAKGSEDSFQPGWYQLDLDESGHTENPQDIDTGNASSQNLKLYEGTDKVTSDYIGNLGNKQPMSVFNIQPNCLPSKGSDLAFNIWIRRFIWKETMKDSWYSTFDNAVDTTWLGNDWISTATGLSIKKVTLFIPLLVTRNNVIGNNEALMTSSGENSISSRAYTSFDESALKQFADIYVQALSQIYTVNPDISEIPMYSGSISEESIIDKTLVSNVLCYAENIKMNNVEFNGENLQELGRRIIEKAKFNPDLIDKNNIEISHDFTYCGTKETPALISTINYSMKHEHKFISSQLNRKSTIVVYNQDKYNIITGNLIPSKFYIYDSDKNNLYSMQTGKFNWSYSDSKIKLQPLTEWDYDKNTIIHPKNDSKLEETITNKKYSASYSIYAGAMTTAKGSFGSFIPFTSFRPEHFIWDVENEKHFYFIAGDQKCRKVHDDLAYKLDDDSPDDVNGTIHYYKIGPSFAYVPLRGEKFYDIYKK